MSEEIARRIEDIRGDRVHGASFLAKEALDVLVLAAVSARGEHSRSLEEVARGLAQAKPAMASIKNMVARFIREMEVRGLGCDPRALERELVAEMQWASREAARRAAEHLPDGATVITCSHSSAVVRAFRAAVASGKRFSVVALESRSGGLALGERLLKEVSAMGLLGRMVSDASVSDAVTESDMGLVGADKLLPDGRIVNAWPTLLLARRAKGSVPLYVVAESYKFDSDPTVEEGFELVTASLITRVVTEMDP